MWFINAQKNKLDLKNVEILFFWNKFINKDHFKFQKHLLYFCFYRTREKMQFYHFLSLERISSWKDKIIKSLFKCWNNSYAILLDYLQCKQTTIFFFVSLKIHTVVFSLRQFKETFVPFSHLICIYLKTIYFGNCCSKDETLD